jgi:SAM-dependent methyltransferase
MTFKYKIDLPLDTPERTLYHREIIRGKKYLRNLYNEWYSIFRKEIHRIPGGKFVELGSGGGFLKELEPAVICTDILPLPTNDLTFSASHMPFDESSVDGIFMVDTFHHLPDVMQFLKEATRVMKSGGSMIMIEPANSYWGRFIYKNFHHEPFDPEGTWNIPVSGPLSGANGALPWIVFVRDRVRFENEFPHFKIESIRYHTPLRYLISGGVSFRQILPSFTYPVFTLIDRWLSGISMQLSMFVTVRIKKQE